MDADFLDRLQRGAALLASVKSRDYHYNERELVYERDKLKLYHYKSSVSYPKTSSASQSSEPAKTIPSSSTLLASQAPQVSTPSAIPLLVVFATVNRPEILDLFPEHSFIRGLLDNGMDVYLLDWGYPDADDYDVGLNDYVNEYLDHAVKYVLEKTAQPTLNLLGVCQGGVICLCYAALNKNVNNLILITTPVDFSTSDNTVGQLLNRIDIEAMTAKHQNVSGAGLSQFFISLRPFELIGKKYLKFIDQLDDDVKINQFLQVEKWLNDAPDQSGRAFREFALACYKENKLIQGQLTLDGRQVNLSNVTIPVLNIMAAQDEIVPISASINLNNYINSSHYTQQVYPSGHIGIYISSQVSSVMPKKIASWLISKS